MSDTATLDPVPTPAPAVASFHLEIPVVEKPERILEGKEELLSEEQQEVLQALSPTCSREDLWRFLSESNRNRNRSFDGIYQFLRFVAQSVERVYGKERVSLIQQQKRTNSFRLVPIEDTNATTSTSTGTS